MKIELFSYPTAQPFAWLGLTHPFFDVNIATLGYTWLAMALLFAAVLIGRRYFRGEANPYTLVLEQSIKFFRDLATESFGHFRYDYFSFIAALFVFTLACNMVGLLPFIEEPTNDLHTTFALGLSSFLYVQAVKISSGGLLGYIKEYFEPFFLMLPLNVVGEIAKVVSMSFRLFGNILGGSIVFLIAVQFVGLWKGWFMLAALFMVPLYWIVGKIVHLRSHPWLQKTFLGVMGLLFALPAAQMFFGIFEGLIQAFVITVLTLTYLSVAVSGAESEEEHRAHS